MNVATAHSRRTESFKAGQETARLVGETLKDNSPDLLFLFSSVGHDLPEMIRGIQSVAGQTPICGCSGSGIISDQGCDEATHSIALMGVQLPKVNLETFIFSGLSADSEKIGAQIADTVTSLNLSPQDKKLLFLFTDGLTVNADALYRGFHENCPYHVDIVGGTAGNDFQSCLTYQFRGERVETDAAAGVLLYGDFHYRIEVSHGSKPIGRFRTITRAEGNVVYEIDHIPALDLLKDFIGADRVKDFGQTLNLFELGESFEGKGYCQDILNRAIIGVEEKQKGIKLAVELLEGAKIKITRRDMDLVLTRTRQMAQAMIAGMPDPDQAAYFYFNCSGRGAYLFGEPEPDVNALREVLGTGKSMIGFFTFGEFAPINNHNYFHNYTGVLVGIQ